jgi:tRNA(fMet)-specific endonuclease VapC
MRRCLLDTGAMGDFINRRHGVDVRVRDARRRGLKIGTCTPVVAELYYGLELSQTRDKNLPRLVQSLRRIVCWTFDRAAAEEYGRLYAELRRLGRPMQQIDVQVAAIAIVLGQCVVVSSDSDLAAVPGLAVENWTV